MSKELEIEALASIILFHKKLYYNGKSQISDLEYDTLEEKLKNKSPHHPVLSLVGYNSSKFYEKIHHITPMLSLAKTYDISELLKFLKNHPCVGLDKFDGMALSLKYDNQGKFQLASTRGNGSFGENVTEHVMHILHIPKNISIQQKWSSYHFEIRGEVYFPLSKFEKFKDRFDSFRNAVPGSLARKEVEDAIDVLHELNFFPYDVLVYSSTNKLLSVEQAKNELEVPIDYFKKLQFICSLGFDLNEEHIYKLPNDLDELLLEKILDNLFSKERDYQIDGLVFRMRDEFIWENLGNTAHHPRGSFAFKRSGETAITEILAIEQNVGRSGKISFRAHLRPVFLSGAKISYATLHNAEFIEQGKYAVGAQVELIRSGEVIPSIIRCVQMASINYELPTQCPCGYNLTRQGPELFCLHQKPCPSKDQESLVHFVSSLNVMGVSDKIILRLRDAGLVKEPSDFYKLKIDDLIQIEGFAKKSSENLIEAFQAARKIPLPQFLMALGLKRGGAVKCQEVAKKFKSLKNVLQMQTKELLQEKGWAEKSTQDFIQSLKERQSWINNLLEFIEVLDDDKEEEQVIQNTQHPCFKKSICITGELSYSREEYKKILENIGAKLISSVTPKTDILISNKISSSSKYKNAVKYGIKILDEKDFLSNYLFLDRL